MVYLLINVFNLNFYQFNPYSIAPLLVATLALIFGFFIYHLENKSDFSRTLLYFCISSAVWLFGVGFLLNSQAPDVSHFWSEVLYIGLIVNPVTILHISLILSNKYTQKKRLIHLTYGIAGLLYILSRTVYFYSSAKYGVLNFYFKTGLVQSMIVLIIVGCLILSSLNMVFYYRSVDDAFEKKQARFWLFSFLIVSLGYVDLLASYSVKIYPYGYIPILWFLLNITFYKLRASYQTLEKRSMQLESEIKEKTQEITRVVEELRATQLKLLETGKISALASLSAGILHQISQPITAIHGFTKFIKKEMKKEETFYRPICLIEEQSVYLKEMLEDLMELIRHREIKKENINVNSCIMRAMNLLSDEMRIRRVHWELNLAEKLPLVHADSVHLQQIFMNVSINALEALSTLERGLPRNLKISTSFDEDKEKVEIFFKDNGPGLDLEHRKQIFEPFFSTKVKGSGIGLALCQDLVAEHGGKITVESEPGKGATFTISLPSVTRG